MKLFYILKILLYIFDIYIYILMYMKKYITLCTRKKILFIYINIKIVFDSYDHAHSTGDTQ